MNFIDFLEKSDAALTGALVTAGFKRRDTGLWLRMSGENINAIELQKNSSNDSFCINLGIHYKFLPGAGVEKALDPDEMRVADCEVKLRLTSTPSEKDQWWPISFESIANLVGLIPNRGLAIFENYRLSGEISRVRAENVLVGNAPLLSSLTKVRACLLIARIQRYLGNTEKSVEAAKAGISIAGMAVGPKKALKQVLQDQGASVDD